MENFFHFFSSIFSIFILIVFVLLLKQLNILKKENGEVFAKVVMQITLPALIFYSLAHTKTLNYDYFVIAIILVFLELIFILLSWFISKKYLRLNNPQTGAFILASTFGSSAMLGYPIISQLFPDNANTLSEAVIISELGVGIGIFSLGVITAIYFGEKEKQLNILNSLLLFFKSPIFISIILGLSYYFFDLPTSGTFFDEFFHILSIISSSNTFFVILSVGIFLNFSNFNGVIILLVIATIIKLVIFPSVMFIPISFMNLNDWQLEVAILESAMPSAMLSVILSSKYGCDTSIASKVVFVTTFFAMFSIGVVAFFI
jgi:predicted permease